MSGVNEIDPVALGLHDIISHRASEAKLNAAYVRVVVQEAGEAIPARPEGALVVHYYTWDEPDIDPERPYDQWFQIDDLTEPEGHFTDFSEFATGVQPEGWTERWNASNSDWTVETFGGAIGGQVLQHVQPSDDGRKLLSINQFDDTDDVDLVTRVRTSSLGGGTQNQMWLVARASGSGGAESAYATQLRGNGFAIAKYVNGVFSDVGVDNGFAVAANTDYWVRFRLESTSLKAKVWTGDPGDEPGTWNVEETDSSLASGWVGVGNFQFNGTRRFDVFGVGTGGASAPKEA